MLYVTNTGDDTVSVIDRLSNSVVSIVKVGRQPKGIVVNPEGTYVYVANFGSNSVSVIDTMTNEYEETIDLHVEADGKVRVYTAMQAMGQGIETSYIQILSETLDLDPECIEIVQGDSDVATGLGSMGSRSLYIGGSAMQTASNETLEKGKELAAESLEAAASDIKYEDGMINYEQIL